MRTGVFTPLIACLDINFKCLFVIIHLVLISFLKLHMLLVPLRVYHASVPDGMTITLSIAKLMNSVHCHHELDHCSPISYRFTRFQ